jgi:hypothetical protein
MLYKTWLPGASIEVAKVIIPEQGGPCTTPVKILKTVHGFITSVTKSRNQSGKITEYLCPWEGLHGSIRLRVGQGHWIQFFRLRYLSVGSQLPLSLRQVSAHDQKLDGSNCSFSYGLLNACNAQW